MNNILFIRGYNTYKSDIYTHLLSVFENNSVCVYDFSYKNNETLESISERLINVLNLRNYKTIITHSLGALILSTLINDNNISNLQNTDNIILLNPKLVNNFFENTLSNIFIKFPFIKYIVKYIPHQLIINKEKLTYNYSSTYIKKYYYMIMSYFTILNTKLLFDIMKYMYYNNIINKYIILQNTKNINIIYSKDDEATYIDENILSTIYNKFNLKIIIGKHESFSPHEKKNIRDIYMLEISNMLI